jgi:hypothetical protein
MLTKKTLVLLLMAFAGSASAEIALTQEEMLGSWQIDSEAITLEGRGAKP